VPKSLGVEVQGYNPWDYYNTNADCGRSLTALHQAASRLAILFRPIVESLLHRDEYLHLADYQSYVDCQKSRSTYRDQEMWTQCRFSTWLMGKFSSDRTIQECQEIWKAEPVKIDLEAYRQGSCWFESKGPRAHLIANALNA